MYSDPVDLIRQQAVELRLHAEDESHHSASQAMDSAADSIDTLLSTLAHRDNDVTSLTLQRDQALRTVADQQERIGSLGTQLIEARQQLAEKDLLINAARITHSNMNDLEERLAAATAERDAIKRTREQEEQYDSMCYELQQLQARLRRLTNIGNLILEADDAAIEELREMGAPTEPGKLTEALRSALASPLPAEGREGKSFQSRCVDWYRLCFNREPHVEPMTRCHRFLEESLELAQSVGVSPAEAAQLVSYVYSRPSGHSTQEIGGVMTTLGVLCQVLAVDMSSCAELGLADAHARIEKIRAKDAAKPAFSPLPGALAQPQAEQKPEHVCGLQGYNGMIDPPCPHPDHRYGARPQAEQP